MIGMASGRSRVFCSGFAGFRRGGLLAGLNPTRGWIFRFKATLRAWRFELYCYTTLKSWRKL